MGSEKIDKWVEKDPEAWSKLAENTNKKETFASFKKKFKAGARTQGKSNAIKHMTNQQIMNIYKASGLSTDQPTTKKIDYTEKAFKPTKIKVKRKGKTYTRTTAPRWQKNTGFGLKIISKMKPKSKEYNEGVKNIMAATGRTRQAVIKKIQRTRKVKK